MKKNINVNIFGILYPIDEDAYELLLKYNENMRRYYANHENGDEIADDIEHRVAELLSELRNNGVQAITIEHVTEIIRRIGNPGEFDMEGETAETNSTGQEKKDNFSSSENIPDGNSTKKLFRDPNDKILGGVISGICHYLGIEDTLIPRLIVVIFLFMSFSTLAIVYIIAWILIPEATTPEDHLRMYGKPVSAKAISEELMKGVGTAKQFVQNPSNQDKARGCLASLVKLFIGIIAFFCLLMLIAMFLGLVGAFIGVVFSLPFLDNELGVVLHSLPDWMCWTAFFCVLLLLVIPIYIIIRWFLKRNDTPSMSPIAKVLLIIAWLAALGTLIYATISIARTIDYNFKENPKEYLLNDSRRLLKKYKMKVGVLNGCNNNIASWNVIPTSTDNNSTQILNLRENSRSQSPFEFDLFRSSKVQPGKYYLEGFVHADGDGSKVYAVLNDTLTSVVYAIPAYGFSNIHRWDDDSILKLPCFDNLTPLDTTLLQTVRAIASDREWDYFHIEFNVDKAGKLKYGYANTSDYPTDIEGNNLTHFKATDIVLRRVE